MILCELDFYPQYEIFVCLYQFVLYVYLYVYDIYYIYSIIEHSITLRQERVP